MLKVLLFLSLLLNAYLVFRSTSAVSKNITIVNNTKEELHHTTSQLPCDEKLITKDSSLPSRMPVQKVQKRESDFEDQDLQENFQDSEELKLHVENFLELNLELTLNQIQKYKELKEEVDKKFQEIFPPLENGERMLLDDDKDFEYRKIQRAQLKRLEKVFGSKKYSLYKKFKSEYNQKQFRNSQPGQPIYIIGF